MLRWFFLCSLLLISCSPVEQTPVRIVTNPWPGYEYLYLAQQKGMFEQAGLNVVLVDVASLADGQRLMMQGRVEGMASTLVELVGVARQNPSHSYIIGLVADYSYGGDMIVARAPIQSLSDLQGFRIGVELQSLGAFFLARALAKEGVDASTIDIVNVEQADAVEWFRDGKIDAMVTYPPTSFALIQAGAQRIFDSRELPGEIVDIVSFRQDAIDDEWLARFHDVWNHSVLYAEQHPQEAIDIMARHEKLSDAEFKDALSQLKVLFQQGLLHAHQQQSQMSQLLLDACATMQMLDSVQRSCDDVTARIKLYYRE